MEIPVRIVDLLLLTKAEFFFWTSSSGWFLCWRLFISFGGNNGISIPHSGADAASWKFRRSNHPHRKVFQHFVDLKKKRNLKKLKFFGSLFLCAAALRPEVLLRPLLSTSGRPCADASARDSATRNYHQQNNKRSNIQKITTSAVALGCNSIPSNSIQLEKSIIIHFLGFKLIQSDLLLTMIKLIFQTWKMNNYRLHWLGISLLISLLIQ